MASSLNEESVEKKLKAVNNTQDSIQSLSLWIIHHKSHHERICQLWIKVMRKTVQPSHRLTLFYLCNDVVQTCKKKASVYHATFKEHLKEAARLVRDVSVKKKVERIFNIWAERNVYDAAFVRTLQEALNYGIKEKTPEPPPVEQTEEDEEESGRILAEFKPHEMIEQITAFTRQATDIKYKLSQITHLKLDMSSAEAVKRLKDRAHGNDFSSQFEDSCNKLAELVKRQKQHLEDQRLLLQTLNTSENFYEEQYREAKIVANAYKNFGARINNMKKKLDELKRTFPAPDSPVPSPDVNAPSPGNTPPHLGYNPVAPGNVANASWYNGNTVEAAGSSGMADSDLYNASPPLEAPSPEGSPPDLNLGSSDNATVSLESRLASFFKQGNSTHSQPSYSPHNSVPTSSLSKVTSKQATTGIEDDGGTTPLDDEIPTTPVQDEVSQTSPPPPPKRSAPPKKENPIDFLSRLISQTQKGAPGGTKTGAASFLDSLTMLNTTSSAKKSDTPSSANTSPQQPWNVWAADSSSTMTPLSSVSNNSSSNTSNGSSVGQPRQPSSPSLTTFAPLSGSGADNTPSSPVQFPSAPTGVPPPIPLPVPPPPMLKINLNVPPPPPPPFLTSPVPPPDFSSPPPPPPVFQQTSPGQKENWPESITPNVQHSKSDPGPTRLADPDAMEIVSDEDETSLGIDNSGGSQSASSFTNLDAQEEFANKLRQKTQGGSLVGNMSSLKSHVFIPNPERPNLMTLTVPDEGNAEDISELDEIVADDKMWKKSSRKSRSRSRSKSREKERSHRHKKKKKHKKNHSDEEELRFSDDGKSHGVGSVVKKIGSRNSRDSRDSGKGDKYDDDRRHDKYEDERRHDKYDDRKYDRYGEKNFKSHKSGTRENKDNVEAYTQAYRNALMQQYSGRYNPYGSGPGPYSTSGSDPRHYNKY